MATRTALIVEDNSDDRRLLQYYLAHLDYRILEAADGAAALEIARREKPDLIVSDALMPDMDGFQFLRRVRETSSLSAIPFVFYSAVYTGHNDRELALSLGADAFIVKPKEPEEFRKELADALENSQGQHARPVPSAHLGEEEFLRRYGNVVSRKVEEKVGELRQVRSALAENELRYRYIFNSIRDAIIISDFERRIIEANQPALKETFGYDLDEIKGHSTRILYADDSGFERAGEAFFQSRAKGSRWKAIESMGRRKNGALFPMELLGIGIRDENDRLTANLGIIRDITQRKEAERQLRAALAEAEGAKDRIAAILRAVPDALVVTDRDDRVIRMNRSAEDLLGMDFDAIRNRPLQELFREPVLLEQHRNVLSGAAEESILDLEMTDRSRREVRTIEARSCAVRGKRGLLTGAVTLLRDITREREITRLKSEFISVAAHELRTPLSSVLGFSELLQSNPDLPEEQKRECLTNIVEKAELLDEILDDFLNLSRIESGHPLHLSKNTFDLGRMVHDLVAHYRSENPRHEFRIEMPEIQHKVTADEQKILQVLDNLISNAVKYSPDGGPVVISIRKDEQMVRVAVTDQGIGMSTDQMERIFDKFYRADTSNTAVAGLGLGMSLAKVIVEDHGGTIGVESEPGSGTSAYFTLPCADASQVPRSQHA